MQYQSIRAVASRLKSQFKIDMDLFEVQMACADALKKMGMIALVRYAIVARIENFAVNLPAYVYKPRSVIKLETLPTECNPRIIEQDIYFPPQVLFQFEENTEETPDPIGTETNYIPHFAGPYVEHVWDSPYLRFNETDTLVGIIANGIKTDEEGLPMIPDAAFFGCLYYSAFVYLQPMFILGQITPQVMAQFERWKDDNVNQSISNMMMESLTDNEKDKLFDIMTSMNRKSYGKPV